MHDMVPSPSAYRVALRRAAHQVFDTPVLFHDSLALPILGRTADALGPDLRAPRRAASRSQRAYLVARAQLAEDAVGAAAAEGVSQYVILGAGLDTFAYRNPYPGLRVFEVDHPATQMWKRSLLRSAGIEEGPDVIFAPSNLNQHSLRDDLAAAGFVPSVKSIFTCLGVVPYLPEAAVREFLAYFGEQCIGSRFLMDYRIPAVELSPIERLEFESLASRTAAVGEPFRLLLSAGEVRGLLLEHGISITDDLRAAELNERYFSERTDDLAVTGAGNRVISGVLRLRP